MNGKSVETTIALIESDIEALQEKTGTLCTACDRCLVRKIVLWLVSLVGVTVVGAIMTLVIRVPK